jgi:hypothetical protein
MNKIAAIGWGLACLAAPANAVVVIQPAAIAAHPAALPLMQRPTPSNGRPSPALGQEPMAIAIPALMIVIILFGLGKPRSPRPVIA